jgi:hypothetical protein
MPLPFWETITPTLEPLIDNLLLALLKGRRPECFNDCAVGIGGPG